MVVVVAEVVVWWADVKEKGGSLHGAPRRTPARDTCQQRDTVQERREREQQGAL